MLVNMINTKDFKVKRRIFIILGSLFLVLGLVEIVLKTVFDVTMAADFIDGFFMGTGTGLVITGLFFIIYYGLILKNREKQKKAEIEAQDERNRFIVMRTGFITFLTSIFTQYIALLVTGIINITAFYVILALIGAELVVALTVWIIVNKIS